MKKKMITVILAMVLCLSASHVEAGVYEDGGTHDITETEIVIILKPDDYGNATTVNLLPGGYVDRYIDMYSPCILNIDVGNADVKGEEWFAVWGGQVNLYSGSIPGVMRFIDGELNLYGGALTSIASDSYASQDQSGVINVYGTDFTFNGEPQDYGTIVNGGMDETGRYFYDLTGTLESGEPLDLTINFNNSDGNYLLTINFIASSAAIPEEMIDALADFIADKTASGAIDNSLTNSLLVKVEGAALAVAGDKPNGAKVTVNRLNALINHVEAQAGKKIEFETAMELIDQVENIILELGG